MIIETKVSVLTMLTGAMLLGQSSLRVDVNLVQVPCVVSDRNGASVTDLKPEEFSLFLDHSPQQIKYVWRDMDLPLTIGLIADVSGSQRAFVQTHRATLMNFLSRVLSSGDRAFLVSIARQQRLVTDLSSSVEELQLGMEHLASEVQPILGQPCSGKGEQQNGGQNYRKVRSHGRASAPCGGTALWNGIFFSARAKLKPEQGRKALLVLTDGQDTGSDHSLTDAIEACQSADTMVYAVHYTRSPYVPALLNPMAAPLTIAILNHQIATGKRNLHRITLETGGAFFENNKAAVLSVFSQIEADLRSQYVLGFTPSDHSHGTHKLQVKVTRPGTSVRARSSYYIE